MTERQESYAGFVQRGGVEVSSKLPAQNLHAAAAIGGGGIWRSKVQLLIHAVSCSVG